MHTIQIAVAVMVAIPFVASSTSAENPPSAAAKSGSVIIRVETIPDLGRGTFRFEGVPAGELDVSRRDRGSLSAGHLASGAHVSTLAHLDPAVAAAGYTLTDIRCDDAASAQSSTGDVRDRKATFRVDDGETVTCVFVLSAQRCRCPKEGTWNVTNHPGAMVCTGVVSMNVPLLPSKGSGTLAVRDGCSTIIASGLSEDEATMQMSLTPDCGYRGTVGGSRDGIPMTIEFLWDVRDERRITGSLRSTVSQQGMTCNMSRTYELEFGGS